MRFDRGSRGFTLAEIVASIALIAVVGVLLVQMFAASDALAGKAHTLDAAVSLCASIADRWKSACAADELPDIPEWRDHIQAEGGQQWRLPVDAQMRPCGEDRAAYVVRLQGSAGQDGVYDLRIRVVAVGPGQEAAPVLHEITVSRYCQ